jgi:hypothetical protein
MDADPSTAAPDPFANAETRAHGFADPHLRLFLGSPKPEEEREVKGPPPAPRSSGWIRRVIRAATAKQKGFAITVSDNAIGVIEGALIWGAAHRSGT